MPTVSFQAFPGRQHGRCGLPKEFEQIREPSVKPALSLGTCAVGISKFMIQDLQLRLQG